MQAGGRGGAKFCQCGQESREGFAATCGGDKERGGIVGAGQHFQLVRMKVPVFGGEPLGKGGGKLGHGDKIGGGGGKGKGLPLPFAFLPPIPNP